MSEIDYGIALWIRQDFRRTHDPWLWVDMDTPTELTDMTESCRMMFDNGNNITIMSWDPEACGFNLKEVKK